MNRRIDVIQTNDISQLIVTTLEDAKAQQIQVLDTSTKSSLFNQIVICSGTSNRQINSLANKVIETLKQNQISIVGEEGAKGGEWILVDAGEIIVHIMLPQARENYNLEELWG